MCELKSGCPLVVFVWWFGHTLTGVWVEILVSVLSMMMELSHPHGCVSWNLPRWFYCWSVCWCHTLTGVWVEICQLWYCCWQSKVTPSRVCELKWLVYKFKISCSCHTLTGVWVEICGVGFSSNAILSHPHGCVSWNVVLLHTIYQYNLSHPHGCVSWNYYILILLNSILSHTLTGVWVEIPGADIICKDCASHTLTGVWVEIRKCL